MTVSLFSWCSILSASSALNVSVRQEQSSFPLPSRLGCSSASSCPLLCNSNIWGFQNFLLIDNAFFHNCIIITAKSHLLRGVLGCLKKSFHQLLLVFDCDNDIFQLNCFYDIIIWFDVQKPLKAHKNHLILYVLTIWNCSWRTIWRAGLILKVVTKRLSLFISQDNALMCVPWLWLPRSFLVPWYPCPPCYTPQHCLPGKRDQDTQVEKYLFPPQGI